MRVISPMVSWRSCRMPNPLRRLAISAAGNWTAASASTNPIWSALRIQDRRVRLQDSRDGVRDAVFIVVARHRPPSLFQFVAGIAHDDGMPSERQHLHVIVVVTNCHDLTSVETAVPGPSLQRMALGAACVQKVHDAQIAKIVLCSQGGEVLPEVE